MLIKYTGTLKECGFKVENTTYTLRKDVFVEISDKIGETLLKQHPTLLHQKLIVKPVAKSRKKAKSSGESTDDN